MGSEPAWTKDATSQAHRLIARFLLQQGYKDTLTSFISEATSTHPSAAPALFPESLAAPIAGEAELCTLVDDWLAAKLARLAVKPEPLLDEINGLECKVKALPTRVGRTVRDATNVLTVSQGVWPSRNWSSEEGRFISEFTPAILTTAVDRTLKLYSKSSYALLDTHSFPSPVLTVSPHPTNPRLVLCASMSGSVFLLDLATRSTLVTLSVHDKYCTKLCWAPDGKHVASLGYDKKVVLYAFEELPPAEGDEPVLLEGEDRDELAGTPRVQLQVVHERTTRTNPEGATFLPASNYLVYSCRDDNLLHYLSLPSGKKEGFESTTFNLNENGDSWVSFSVLSISLHPFLPLLALQTSTASARILLYPFHSSLRLSTLHTTASQSEFFTPRHSWLPDGTAIAVNSEDGIVRVVDLKGKVSLALGAHGAAAPLEGGDEDGELDARQRARREAERGSSVIKDVEVGEDGEGGWVIWSVGFDKTCKALVR